MYKLENLIKLSLNETNPDLVLKGGNIVNVFTNEIIKSDVAIDNGIIVGIGEYHGKREIDVANKYIVPGFIDSHLHIESTMLTPKEFCKAVLPRGTTTVIADPHEISNICGLDGINYMLEESENLPMDIFYMLPSCVPCTEFESNGAILKAKDLQSLINKDMILGLGEMMNYPGVISKNNEVLSKLKLAIDNNKIIDGHGPHIKDKELNAYVISGVTTEHECSTIEEMIDRLRLGMYILIREGSAAKNLNDLIKAVNKDNISRCLLCSDDRHPEEILNKGHINHSIKLAISKGIEVIDAIKMATINPAICYKLKNKGAIAPGYDADLLIIDNFNNFYIEKVYKKGILVAKYNKPLFNVVYKNSYEENFVNTVNISNIRKENLQIKITSEKVNIIRVLPHSLETKKIIKRVKTKNNKFTFDKDEDILKLAVIERHGKNNNIGLALVENFKLRNGAIASTIAHDSHNLIVIGDNDEDIICAVNEVKRCRGGIAISSNKKILESLPLEIAGLMSSKDIEFVNLKFERMLDIAYNYLNVNKDIDPFMTLSFMALPVIGDIKLTDKGLFDVNKFKFIDINNK
ncbi:adenine deaminase [Terrisporobacter sp.]